MKYIALLLFIVQFTGYTEAQKPNRKINISKWTEFTSSLEKPLFKKINDSLFFGFYRTYTDTAGIIVLDKDLNIRNNISLKISNNGYEYYSFQNKLKFTKNPVYYYRPDINAAVLLGNCKLAENRFAAIAFTYSLSSDSLISTDTLLNSRKDDFEIKLTDNDKFFTISSRRLSEIDLVSKNMDNMEFHVFYANCKQAYFISSQLPGNAKCCFKVATDGSILVCTVIDHGKNSDISFSLFDQNGKLQGNLNYSVPITDIYIYKPETFLVSPNNEIYCVFSKMLSQFEGLAIFKLNFSGNSCKKIAEKIFDKKYMVQLSKQTKPNFTLVESNEIKPLTKLKDFRIQSAFIDKNGIYVLLSDLRSEYYQVSQDNENIKSFVSENIIALGFNHDGNDLWLTPIKRDAMCVDVKVHDNEVNFYNSFGSGIEITPFEDENYINLLIPSLGKVFASRINKTNGIMDNPLIVLDEEKTFTNGAANYWVDSNNVIFLTLKGIFLEKSKREIFIKKEEINF